MVTTPPTSAALAAAPLPRRRTRRAALVAAGAGLAVSALGASLLHASPVAAKASKPKNPPCVVWTADPGAPDVVQAVVVGVKTGKNDDALDITQGWMWLTPDGKTLQVKLTVVNLSSDAKSNIPTGATGVDWYMLWKSDGGATYFAHASQDITGATSYHDGSPSAQDASLYQDNNTISGSMTPGANGVIEIDVPASHIGHPAAGSLFDSPAGEGDVEHGVPGVAGSLTKIKTAGPDQSYVAGKGCTAAASGNAVHAHTTTPSSTQSSPVVAAPAAVVRFAQIRRLMALNTDA